MRYSPWDEVGRLGHVIVHRHSFASDVDAMWCPEEQVILLRDGLSRVQARCALAHELAHMRRGDAHIDGRDASRLRRRQEAAADRDAARLLIDVHELAAAMAAHPHDPAAVAEELDVTREVLATRLEHPHPAERGFLLGRLDRAEGAA